jgi:hypothetical protein
MVDGPIESVPFPSRGQRHSLARADPPRLRTTHEILQTEEGKQDEDHAIQTGTVAITTK